MCGKHPTLLHEGTDILVEYLLVLRLVQFVQDTTEGKQAQGHGKMEAGVVECQGVWLVLWCRG